MVKNINLGCAARKPQIRKKAITDATIPKATDSALILIFIMHPHTFALGVRTVHVAAVRV